MPINVNDPEYVKAEKEFNESSNSEGRLISLKKMISHAPKHKGGENLRQQLTTRRKKLEQEIEKKNKSGKSSQVGIKKEEMQAVIVGKTNSGKSSLLKSLTNAEPKISDTKFTTKLPFIGMMPFQEANIQLIEIPSIESEYYEKGIVYTSDLIIILINNLEEIKEIENILSTQGKKIIVFNNKYNLDKRKIEANLKSKYKNYPYSIISTKSKEGIEELKQKVFKNFEKIRVYTKEPGKEKSSRPLILNPESSIKEVAEKIFKTSKPEKIVKETRITGPSGKFPNQIVGLSHKLKDLDIVEFKTR